MAPSALADPPVVEITSPAGGEYFDFSSVPVEFSVTGDLLLSDSCDVDGGLSLPCSSPFHADSLSEGSHTVNVTSLNVGLESGSDSVQFTVDTVDPDVSISSPIDLSHITESAPSIVFSATDDNLDSVTCQVDAEPATPCISGWSAPSLLDGSHTVTVLATDLAGNSSSATSEFTVDTVLPLVSISSPVDGDVLAFGDFDVFFTATDDNLDVVECSLDGGTPVACSSSYSLVGLTDGNYSFVVSATDEAGNSASAPITFTVDLLDPILSITQPSDGAHLDSSNVDVEFDAADTNLVDTECEVDGGGFSSCGSPLNLTGMLDGTHEVSVRATDAAGRVTDRSVSFMVDTVDPVVDITSPAAASWSNENNVDVEFTATDANTLDVECSIDTGSFSNCTSPFSTGSLPDGTHTVYVRATDLAGNETEQSVGLQVDQTDPAVSIAAPTASQFVQSEDVNVSFTATDANIDTVECSTDGGAFAGCTSPLTLIDLDQGAHTVAVRARDEAGNETLVTRAFSVDSITPAVSITAPSADSFHDSTTVPVSFTATDTNIDDVECQLGSGAFSACTSPYSPSGLAQGEHTVTVRATDFAGKVGQASVSFTVDTIDPAVSISTPTADQHLATDDVSINFSATDANLTSVECRVGSNSFAACTSPYALNDLAQGSHTVQVRATDAAANVTTVSRTFVVDTIPPAVSISSPTPSQYFNSTSVPVSFSATDANIASVTCEIDGGGFSACSSPRNYTDLSQGDHTVTVRATDLAGTATNASVTFRVDSIAPAVNVSAPTEDAFVDSTSVNVAFTATDTNALTVECDVDLGGFSPCTSPLALSGLSQGQHTVVVRATDPAGNTTSVTREFTVDSIDPVVSISSPTPSQYFNSTTVPVSFSATDANIASVTCQIDGGSFSGCTSPRNYMSLAQGNHTVVVRATDLAGNSTDDSVTFRVDSIAPAVNVSFPTEDAFVASTIVNLAFTATDTNPLTVDCNVDSGGFSPCTSPLVLTGLAQGQHTVIVRVTDPAGNSTSVTREFTVDTVAPTVSIASPTPNQYFDSTTVGSTFTANDQNGVTTTCRLDSGTFVPCTSPASASSLSQGEHTLTVRATDPAGNSADASVTFYVDSIDPVVSVSYPTQNAHVASTNVNVAFSATDANTLTVDCNVDSGGFSPCGSPLELTNLSQGAHVVIVRATDPAGNAVSVTRNFTVDTVAPAVSISSPTAGQYFSSTSVPVSFSATDTNIATVTCRIDGGSFSACTSPKNYTGLSQGDHTVVVRAVDQAGNATEDDVTFRVDTINPVVTITAPAAGQYFNVDDVNISFTATDTNALTVECRLDGGSFAPCSSPYQLTDLSQGSHTAYVRATDPAGNPTSQSVTFHIDTISPNVSITSPANDAFVNSTTVSASFTATDANSLVVECRLDLTTYTACSSPASLPGVTQGDHTIYVRATDPAGNTTTAAVEITVDSIYPAVTITAPTAAQHLQSDDVNVDFATTDTNTLIVECRLTSGSYSACSDQFELTALNDGAHTVQVRAIDPAGNATTQSRTFTVDTINPVVDITSPDAGAFLDTAVVTANFDASDANITSVQCRIDQGPSQACGSPYPTVPLDDNTYTLEVTATDQSGRSTTDSVEFTVDTEKPEVSITYPDDVVDEYINNDLRPDAEYSATDGNLQSVVCRINGAIVDSNCDPQEYDISSLPEGQHVFRVEATDLAGNHIGAESTFTVDTIDPAVAITSPTSGSFFNKNEVSKAFTATDTNIEPEAIECRLDNAPYDTCTSPLDYSSLPDGLHTSRVRGTDRAGNQTERIVQFTVDTIPPTVTVTSPAFGQVVSSSDVAVSFVGNDATALSYECKTNDGAFAPCGNPFTLSGLDDGTFMSTIRATDRAGNTNTGGVQFSVDLTSPNIAERFGVAKPKGKTPLKLTKKAKLIFRDEFSEPSINRRKWATLRGTLKFPYASSYNVDKEAATYSRDNVAIENGKAVLSLKRKPEGSDPTHPYSSGMLHTGNHFSFKHGYVEARVKVPKCSGCWPAFWMLNAPVDEEWPPEIDIFEFFNTVKDKRPKMNVHWKAGSRNKQWGSKKYGDRKRDYTRGWHTYGLAWNSKRAQVFVDGKPGPIYKTGRNLPKKANYLIFNLALQKGFNPKGVSKMSIDYVRVWK